MSEQKETAQTIGTVERLEDQTIIRFGKSEAVITKDSINVRVQST
ncbi:hypothetical protein [Sporomusa sp. KB1]|jgi:hypothetical protein|nr:hypothetical protein [Sporomusa sp. KB1]TWH49580.1 hypothetical protein Salpa_5818 [Sporomusa sp. KB1]